MSVQSVERLTESTLPKQLPRRGVQAILATMDYLRLPKDGYFVIGGANLVLRGIKTDTPDIDVMVANGIFDLLSRRKGAEIKEPPQSAKDRGATNTSVWLESSKMLLPVSATTHLGDGYYPMTFYESCFYTEELQE